MKNNFYFSEEQKIIIEDSSRIKLINGCAGSRKTDTIIKNGIINLIKNKQNILYITFVSSVSDEIKNRIEKLLNIKIPRVGNSNHFITSYNNNYIEIANFDAWVYKQFDFISKTFLVKDKKVIQNCATYISNYNFNSKKEGFVQNLWKGNKILIYFYKIHYILYQ